MENPLHGFSTVVFRQDRFTRFGWWSVAVAHRCNPLPGRMGGHMVEAILHESEMIGCQRHDVDADMVLVCAFTSTFRRLVTGMDDVVARSARLVYQFPKPYGFGVIRSRPSGGVGRLRGLESGWSRPHRCPASLPEQSFDLWEGRVQRDLVVVHARQDVAGGVGVRVQHDSVQAVKPIPAPFPCRSPVRESICDV